MSNRLEQIQNWPELAEQAQWSVSALAKKCGVSVRTLERHFIQQMGKSPKVWLTGQRQEQARKLLKGGWRVKEVANLLIYKHSSHFTNDFKQHWGQCPSNLT